MQQHHPTKFILACVDFFTRIYKLKTFVNKRTNKICKTFIKRFNKVEKTNIVITIIGKNYTL